MPITRSGYAKQHRNGSTRAYRKARATIISDATHCHICGKPFNPTDPIETDHIIAYADNGPHTPDNLRPVHKTCNRTRGRGGGVTTQ